MSTSLYPTTISMPLQSRNTRRGNGLCLLSFDAGGSRCISQLKILAEMMHRLNFGANNDSMDRPCAVFDMIGGVGSGGFIAILLVVFGLTAEETLNEFVDLSVNVLDKLGLDAQSRTKALRSHNDSLMIKYGMSQDARLLDSNDRSKGCKLAVPISYKHHIGSTCVLRNSSVRQEKALDLTIVDALLATMATPPLFESFSITKDAAVFEYTGADWTLSNPTQEIIVEAHSVFGAEGMVACVLSLGCGHSGVFSFPESLESVEWTRTMENLATDAESKAQSLESQMEFLGLYHRFSVTNGLERAQAMNFLDSGAIIAHTAVYIGNVQVSRRLDACIHSLSVQDGISSLEQLTHTGGNITSRPHLPPLTRTFVMRKEPWDFINGVILEPREAHDTDTSRMLIVTGIGGCGKTQLMIKFMNVHGTEFSSQFFIDGSSEERIKADIVRNVRALGTEHSQKGFDECIIFLSNSKSGRPRLLLYDNVDDPELDLSPLLPRSSSCTIAITSRNRLIGKQHPESHLALDIMSIEEAVDLLSHGLLPTANQGRKDVEDLASALGCLPIALQQARSYMQQTGCSTKAYLERLSTNRARLLGQEIKQQVDMKAISTYAAFETSFSRLVLHAQKFLRLLAHFHWSGFPLDLIILAAKHHFSEYSREPIDHGSEFYSGKRILEEIFHRNREWDATHLDDMLLSLQNYSLVMVVSGGDTSMLQMHPLVHEWLLSRAPQFDQDVYRSAAVLLLALGEHGGDTAIMQHLSSHVMHMSPLWDHLHTNNITAFAYILYENGDFKEASKLQEKVINELRKTLDTDDMHLNYSLWALAHTYYYCTRLEEAQQLQEEVLITCKRVLGERHSDTLRASITLAAIYADLGRLAEAEALEIEVLKTSKEVLGERDPNTLYASVDLATTYRDSGRKAEAMEIEVEALKLSKELLGENAPYTLLLSVHLGDLYRELGRLEDAEAAQVEALAACRVALGKRHPTTIEASDSLEAIYRALRQLKEATVIQAEVEGIRGSLDEATGEQNASLVAEPAGTSQPQVKQRWYTKLTSKKLFIKCHKRFIG